MTLLVNSLIYAESESDDRLSTLRILEFVEHPEDGQCVILISLSKKSRTEKPRCLPVADVEQWLADGIYEISLDDPYLVDERKGSYRLSKKQRKVRKRRFKAIKPLINDPTFLFRYATKRRVPDVCKRASKCPGSKQAFYYWLTMFFRRGQTKNALAAGTYRCGSPGNQKKLSDKKTGRPRPIHLGGTQLDPGINTSEKNKKHIKKIIEKDYAKKNGPSLQTCYENFLDKHNKDALVAAEYSGERIAAITTSQFYYWARELCDWNKITKQRMYESEYQGTARQLLGSVSDYAAAPGDIFETDSTLVPLHLVAESNRNDVIGKPPCYFVVDSSSRMITGMHLTIEAESWVQSAQGLSNAFLPKDEFCKRHYVTLAPGAWPCHHMPRALLCDRKENLSKAAEEALENLGIRAEYPPPRRGDRKPIVERLWGVSAELLWHRCPGTTFSRNRRSGEPDPRLDACLTISEVIQLTIEMILYRNTYHEIVDICTLEMIEQGLAPTPLNAWNEHIRNHTHSLRKVNDEQVRAELLRPATASVTERGIVCEDVRYSCELAENQKWFETSRREGRWSLDARVDDTWSSEVFVRDPDTGEMLKCHILSSERLAADKPLADVRYIKEYLKKVEERPNQMVGKIELGRKIEEVVKNAQQEKAEQPPPPSKRAKVLKIPTNRQREMEQRKSNKKPKAATKSPKYDQGILDILQQGPSEDG